MIVVFPIGIVVDIVIGFDVLVDLLLRHHRFFSLLLLLTLFFRLLLVSYQNHTIGIISLLFVPSVNVLNTSYQNCKYIARNYL